MADVEVYAKAIAKAGSLDKKAVRDAIAASDFQSAYAHVKFASNGQIDVPQIAIQIQDGKVVPVYGEKMINKPRYPVPGWDKRQSALHAKSGQLLPAFETERRELGVEL